MKPMDINQSSIAYKMAEDIATLKKEVAELKQNITRLEAATVEIAVVLRDTPEAVSSD